jgi:hypothetical protein
MSERNIPDRVFRHAAKRVLEPWEYEEIEKAAARDVERVLRSYAKDKEEFPAPTD